jgi:histidinol-phosphate/aromatic aminotransferase/cobyric acid decarboxylase-like protein
MVIRPDWTEPIKTKLIDLSRNVHYDSTLQTIISQLLSNDCFTDYPNQFDLYKAISDYYTVPLSNISIGYGATEIIERCFKAFDLKHLYIVSPAFEMVEIYCQLYKIPYTLVSYSDIQHISTGNTLYLANPNGNDGQAYDVTEHLNKFDLVLVDEVYSDFYDQYSLLYRLASNVVVIKSFSKSLGIAGFRAGFAVAIEPIISQLQLYRSNFVMCSFSSIIIPKIIHLLPEVISRMNETKEYLETHYSCVPSKANYVLFKRPNRYTEIFGCKKVDSLYRSALTDMNTLWKYQIA